MAENENLYLISKELVSRCFKNRGVADDEQPALRHELILEISKELRNVFDAGVSRGKGASPLAGVDASVLQKVNLIENRLDVISAEVHKLREERKGELSPLELFHKLQKLGKEVEEIKNRFPQLITKKEDV